MANAINMRTVEEVKADLALAQGKLDDALRAYLQRTSRTEFYVEDIETIFNFITCIFILLYFFTDYCQYCFVHKR